MRLSLNFLFILITYWVLILDKVEGDKDEKFVKNRPKFQENSPRKPPGDDYKNRRNNKYRDLSEDDDEESAEFKSKNKKSNEDRWTKNYKKIRVVEESDESSSESVEETSNQKNKHSREDKFKETLKYNQINRKTTIQENNKNIKLQGVGKSNDKLVKSNIQKEESTKHLKTSSNKKSKDLGGKKIKTISETSEDESSEENKINKKEIYQRPLEKVRTRATIKKIPEKIETRKKIAQDDKDHEENDDTEEDSESQICRNKRLKDSDDESNDTDETSEDFKDSIQCDSLDDDCDD